MYAFPLKSDEEVRSADVLRAETLKMEDYDEVENIMGDKDKTDDKINGRNSKSGKSNDPNMATGLLGEKKEDRKDEEDDDEEEKRANKNDRSEARSVMESKNDFRKNESEKGLSEVGDNVDNIHDDQAFIVKLGRADYIDFQEFCRLLSVFNPRFNIDEKVKFYFRIFDFDQDKKITDDDLMKVISMMFGAVDSENGMEFPLEDRKHLVEKLMQEADTGQKEYLDVDDLEKILWVTNIEQKCSMTFFIA
jgi:Ca2+-binding EF-hand superfamily protein